MNRYIPPPGYPTITRPMRLAVLRCINANDAGHPCSGCRITGPKLRALGLFKVVGKDAAKNELWELTEAGRQLYEEHLRFGT